jgi:hypothetical protein
MISCSLFKILSLDGFVIVINADGFFHALLDNQNSPHTSPRRAPEERSTFRRFTGGDGFFQARRPLSLSIREWFLTFHTISKVVLVVLK